MANIAASKVTSTERNRLTRDKRIRTDCVPPFEAPRRGRVKSLLSQTFREWRSDKASRHAAALAYYTALSIGPIVVIAIGIAGLVFGQDAARSAILGQFSEMLGREAGGTVESMIDSAAEPKTSIVATIAGIAVLLFGASGVFAELQGSLDTIWQVKPKPGKGIWRFIRKRFLSMTLVLGVGFLLTVSLVLSAGLTALGHFTEGFAGHAALWEAAHFVVSIGVITILFALIFKILPDVKIKWADVWIGAAVTAVLFSIGKLLIGLYIGRAGVASSYGAAGSVVVMLVWIYYSAQIFLFGAEFTQAYAKIFGSHIEPAEGAVREDVDDAVLDGSERFA